MKRLLLPIVALFIVLLPAGPAAAHPLDVYLQAAYLTPAPATIMLDLDVSPGVLVAPSALNDLDGDRDTRITQTEARAYADQIFQHVQLHADDRTLPLTITMIDVPAYVVLQAGYGKLRIHARATGAPTSVGSHELFFRNDYAPRGSAYQVNAVLGTKSAVTLSAQHRDPAQQQSRIEYRIDAAPAAGPVRNDAAQPQATAQTDRLVRLLESPSLSVIVVLFALGLAALLGALHALTPGHAKTLMAAYLVGSGGTTRNALTLGAVVTFTHTASVIVIGLVALFASSFLLPGLLVPALELLSGLLVLVIGLRLIRRRRPRRTPSAVAVHHPTREPALVGAGHKHDEHSHDHVHSHDHDHDHSHGDRTHTHTLPVGGITARGIIAMGVSGGMVPCPEALGVMIVAVGVNRTVLGLGLILSFSLGLAAVLMGLGILLVRSRHLVSRFERAGTRWTTVLPLVSAVVVAALGAGLIVKGLNAGLPLLQ